MKKAIGTLLIAVLLLTTAMYAFADETAPADKAGSVIKAAIGTVKSEDGTATATVSGEARSVKAGTAETEAASSETETALSEAEEKLEDSIDPALLETTGIRSGDWEYEKAEGSATLTVYHGKSNDVVIPSKIDGYTVTSLSDDLFNENDYITSVTIADSVIYIGSYAFYECTGLKTITFGKQVQEIESYAFFGCSSVEELVLPASLEMIGEYAFQYMTSLKSVNIPKNVISLGYNAFADDEKLENIYFNAVNCETEGNVFNNTGTQSESFTFTVGKGVEKVPDNLCYSDDDCTNAYITSLVLNNSVTSIGENAFYNCVSLSSITWSTYLELIDECAFSGCDSLVTIIFPKGLKTIEMSAFSSCDSLKNISFMPGVKKVGYAFDYCENLEKVYVYGKTTQIVHDQFDMAKPDVKIYCYKDSPADDMAQDCGYKFEYFTRDSYFPDVPPDHNYQKAVYWASDAGIAAGYNNGRFGVTDNITRGQVVMFLWRLAGKPDPLKSTQTFNDVPTTHSYYKAIQWASEKKITAGYKSGDFGVNDNCTRGQIVTFLWRYKGKPAPSSTKPRFLDVPKTHNYFSPVQWASGEGITAGYTDGTFKPANTCTRGQCVTFLYRLEH